MVADAEGTTLPESDTTPDDILIEDPVTGKSRRISRFWAFTESIQFISALAGAGDFIAQG